ncbi:MAG: hypothetical protein HYZ09_01225 [Candidatus Kerfeldbacteria bacterium]|nr:hypothetical protein [Candidatus Kerfeldbacteria bacterium]
MLRLFGLIVLILASVRSVVAKESVTLLLGEWPNAKGAAVTYVSDGGGWMSSPFLFLNGDAFEYAGGVWVERRPMTVSLGPIVGVLNVLKDPELLAGGQALLRLKVGRTEFLGRAFSRHTQRERLHHSFILGASQTFAPGTIGVYYEPIRHQDPWNHRLAVRMTVPFPRFRASLEVRSLSLEDRVSVGLDLTIPLK